MPAATADWAAECGSRDPLTGSGRPLGPAAGTPNSPSTGAGVLRTTSKPTGICPDCAPEEVGNSSVDLLRPTAATLRSRVGRTLPALRVGLTEAFCSALQSREQLSRQRRLAVRCVDETPVARRCQRPHEPLEIRSRIPDPHRGHRLLGINANDRAVCKSACSLSASAAESGVTTMYHSQLTRVWSGPGPSGLNLQGNPAGGCRQPRHLWSELQGAHCVEGGDRFARHHIGRSCGSIAVTEPARPTRRPRTNAHRAIPAGTTRHSACVAGARNNCAASKIPTVHDHAPTSSTSSSPIRRRPHGSASPFRPACPRHDHRGLDTPPPSRRLRLADSWD